MSGNSYSSTCPKCGSEMQSYNDWKPYDMVSHECLECGFYVFCDSDRYSLLEVNELRADMGQEPLIALKGWNDE